MQSRVALTAALFLAVCGHPAGSGPAANAGASDAPAAAPPENLPAGQWELTSEVIRFMSADSRPLILMKVGDHASASVCVGGGPQAPAALFVEAGYDCTMPSHYVRNGLLDVTLRCRRRDLPGEIDQAIQGEYTDGTLTYRRDIRTEFATDGNVQIEQEVRGRRTGDCTGGAGGPAGNNH